jgi:Family of unknown function (DUF6529)
MLLAEDYSPEVTIAKVVLATVIVVLAVYQALLMAVVYGKMPVPFLARRVASRTHRIVGDTAALLALIVAYFCVTGYEVGDALEDGGRTAVHVVAGSAVLVVLAGKVLVVRRGGPRAGRFLPLLGISVLGLFVLTWATSAVASFG